MRRVLISTKPFIFVLFLVGITVRSAESLSSAIPLSTSTKRANSKRANHGRSRLFQDAVSSVSFWLRSFPVCGWQTRSLSSVSGLPTRWRCVRGWLMRLLWAYEHDFPDTPDPELTAMLTRAAVSIGLEVTRPPSPEPSRLDDWFLGERSRCTCAHKTPPPGGTVRVSRPRPVSWQPLSRPKLIVLQARQPPHCTPWLSCRFTKPRRSNRCTRVVPTRVWCRSCARRLTSLYARRKSQRGPSGRRCPPWLSRSAISVSTWQRWRTSTRHAFSTPRRHRRGLCPAVLGGTAADRGDPAHLPRRDVPSTAAPGARPQSACRRGRPPGSSKAAPLQASASSLSQ